MILLPCHPHPPLARLQAVRSLRLRLPHPRRVAPAVEVAHLVPIPHILAVVAVDRDAEMVAGGEVAAIRLRQGRLTRAHPVGPEEVEIIAKGDVT